MDPKTQRRLEREGENALIDLEEIVAVRFEYAQTILKIQSEETRRVVWRMVEQMRAMAGEPRFLHKGNRFPAEASRIEAIQQKNLTWIAVRLLVACAIYEIQIANFKLPTDKCARCAKEVERS